MSVESVLIQYLPKVYSSSPASFVTSSKGRAQGPDLSHWEISYDPDLAVETANFAITKATDGMYGVDPALDSIWKGIRKLPITGLFHYQRSGTSWMGQADHFLTKVNLYNPNIVALDVETTFNAINDTFFQDSYRILRYLESKLAGRNGVRVVLYTNPTIFENFIWPIWLRYFGLEGERYAETVPLWIAQYWNVRSPDKDPGMPSQRNTWNIYQWTDRGISADWGGGAASIDLNVFNGSYETMRLWLGLDLEEPTPDPTPEPVPELPVEPIPELETWKGTMVSPTRLRVRHFPDLTPESLTGQYIYLGQTVKGRLWVGDTYVWMKITDISHPFFGKWVAVRNLEGTVKLLRLERVVYSEPRPANTFWLVKQDIEMGPIWRPNLPQVHPLFVEPRSTVGTHYAPMQAWMQRLAVRANPDMPLNVLSHGYWTHEWITNEQGFDENHGGRANFIMNIDTNLDLPKCESLTSGGSLLEAISVGNGWHKVVGLHYNDPITFEFFQSHPQFWTRGTYVGRTGNVYRILGDKYQGEAMIHPLIANTRTFGLFIQSSKLKEWRSPEIPDPLKIYP